MDTYCCFIAYTNNNKSTIFINRSIDTTVVSIFSKPLVITLANQVSGHNYLNIVSHLKLNELIHLNYYIIM